MPPEPAATFVCPPANRRRAAAAIVLACTGLAAAQCPTTAPTTTRAAAPRSAFGSEAQARREASGSKTATDRITLADGAEYWLYTPPGYTGGAEPPLLVCLHGTDDTAADALAFWIGCADPPNMLVAAPQAAGRGWSETDLSRLHAVWRDVQDRRSFDPDRVWLAGFSAGGAMAFHWLYVEGFGATAVATLANYLPPGITDAQIAARRHVPVFYGVGMRDINRERMHAGLAQLRANDVRVTLYRPPIGHTLSPAVGRHAVEWFTERADAAVHARLIDAADAVHREVPGARGRAAGLAESVLAQQHWHAPENVANATQLLESAAAWGRAQLAESDRLTDAGRHVAAFDLLTDVEREYAGASMAEEARRRREALIQRPGVAEAIDARVRREREDTARSLYLDAQRLLAGGEVDQARRRCETILNAYAETPYARRASQMLDKLPRRPLP